MTDANKLLAFIRVLYKDEKDRCETCTEYDGYGCGRCGSGIAQKT